jgi:putative protein-disulfide isomerase
MTTLHYIFDPLCGWCYAVAPLIKASSALPGLKLTFHSGGMLTGARRQRITPQWRDYVMPHDQRIAQLTGQPFSEAYFEGLLRDTTALMDSAPPSTAILAAEEIAGRGLEMTHRLQHAHYAEGRRIADQSVILALAAELGLEEASFKAAFEHLEGAATDAHFRDSRQWLARAGGQGFPTIALEHTDGRLETLDIGRFLGQPQAWTDFLVTRVPAPAEVTSLPQCGIDGCAI